MIEDNETLLKQIPLGEDSVLELKEIRYSNNNIIGPHRDSFAEEMAAMANAHGGMIVLGVDDKTHSITGLPSDKMDIIETWVREIANDVIKPPLVCRIKKVLALSGQEEKNIIRIDIPQSIFVHDSPGGYFYRIGSSRRKITPEALARLFQQRTQTRLIRFDEQIVKHASIEDIDQKLWERFLTDLSPKDKIEFLGKMKLISADEDGLYYPTISGILMANDSPERFITNAYIQAVCYKGEDRNSIQLDAQDITGPLDIQIKEACKFVNRNMRIKAIKDFGRIETPQYSISAVFEAIVNAVAHRDYSIFGLKIRLHIFSDRLEFYSPGSIPNSMTIESLYLRQSSRNELITSLLARCPINVETYSKRRYLMDKRGEGVPIILSESYALSGKMPEYTLIDDTELRLVIFAAF